MMFWFLVTLLCLLALAFLVLGFRSAAGRVQGVDVATLYRDRLRELERECKLGVIAPDTFDSMRDELERRFLREQEQSQRARTGADGPRWVLPVTGLAVLLLSVLLYARIGAIGDWRTQQMLDAVNHAASTGEGPGEQATLLAQRMREVLARDPDNVRYRYALAAMEMEWGSASRALEHYRELVRLLPRDADILAQAAQLAYLDGGRRITEEVRDWTRRALEIEPEQGIALGMAGIDAFEQGRYAEARDIWRRLLTQLPEDSPGARVIAQGLREAESRLLAQDPDAPRIRVSVSLGAELPAQGVLFVFARREGAEAGSPPLAVARLSEPQFPLEVVLDDTAAMLPEQGLSSAGKVVIVARLSRSGQAGASAQDLQAVSDAIPVRPGTQQIELDLRPLGG